jgi:HSP20 family protein
MIRSLPYIPEHYSYPGEYIPLPQAEDLLKKVNKALGSKPLVNIEEYPDSYKVEVNIPGAKREDIFINTNDRILSIIVLRMTCENVHYQIQRHEFDNRSIERHVFLPADADTEFVSAEYKEGIVCMHIPRSEGHPSLSSGRIVVY